MDNSTISTTVPFSTEVSQDQIVTSVVIGSLLLLLVVLNVGLFVMYRLSMRSRKARAVRPVGEGVGGVLLLQVNPTAAALVTRDSIISLAAPPPRDRYRKLDPLRKTSSTLSSSYEFELRKSSGHLGSHELIPERKTLSLSNSCEFDSNLRKSRTDPGSHELSMNPEGQEKMIGHQNLNSSNERRQNQCDLVGGKSVYDVDNEINASTEVKAEVEIKSSNSDLLAKRKSHSASLCQIEKRETVLLDGDKCVSRSVTEIRQTETSPGCDGYTSENNGQPNMKDRVSSSKDRVVPENGGQIKTAFYVTPIKDEDISKTVSASECSDNACVITNETPISDREKNTLSNNTTPKDGTISNSVNKTQSKSTSSVNAEHVSQSDRQIDNKYDDILGSRSPSQTKHSGSPLKQRHVSGSVSESDFDIDSADELQFIDDMHNMCDDALDKGRKLQLPVAEFHNDSFEMKEKEKRTLADLHDVNDIEL